MYTEAGLFGEENTIPEGSRGKDIGECIFYANGPPSSSFHKETKNNEGTKLDEILQEKIPEKPLLDTMLEKCSKNIWGIKGKCLPELLAQIETERDPRLFKEKILSAMQLYFDGLVESGKFLFHNSGIWAQQSVALDALLRGVRLTVSGFYTNSMPFEEVCETIRPYTQAIITHGSKDKSKARHLVGSEIEVRNGAADIASALANESIDLIMPVASGGFEPAALIAGDLNIETMFPVRYSCVSKNDRRVLVPSQMPEKKIRENLEGKKVLIIDDIVSSGTTIKKIASWIRGYTPARVYVGIASKVYNFGGKGLEKYNLHQHPSSQHLVVG